VGFLEAIKKVKGRVCSGHSSTVQYSTVQCSAVQYSAEQYRTVLQKEGMSLLEAIKKVKVQCTASEHRNPVRYSTVQYSTVQYSIG